MRTPTLYAFSEPTTLHFLMHASRARVGRFTIGLHSRKIVFKIYPDTHEVGTRRKTISNRPDGRQKNFVSGWTRSLFFFGRFSHVFEIEPDILDFTRTIFSGKGGFIHFPLWSFSVHPPSFCVRPDIEKKQSHTTIRPISIHLTHPYGHDLFFLMLFLAIWLVVRIILRVRVFETPSLILFVL
jgi:hypothetical protein